MSKNVTSFINKLEKLNDTELEVFVPSLKKVVKAKSLNLKQQKDLISTVLDGLKGSIDFNKTLNRIILNNTTVKDLKIYDKIPLLVALRVNSLGTIIKMGDEDPIDLQRVLDNIKSTPFELKDTKVVKHEDLKITLKIPTLRQESLLLNKCEQDVTDAGEGSFKAGIGLIYLIEIVKYIESLEIGEEKIDLEDVRVSERMELVENLPLVVYTEISRFIQEVNEYTNKLLQVDNYEISIDADFFDISDDE